jgi:hypothetical protein
MRRVCLDFQFMLLSVAVAGFILLVASCLGQPQHQPSATQDNSLKKFLHEYLKDPRVDDDKTTRYSPVFVHLKDDGAKEVIVYLTGRYWCGSGGCVTLMLAPEGSSYRVVT